MVIIKKFTIMYEKYNAKLENKTLWYDIHKQKT